MKRIETKNCWSIETFDVENIAELKDGKFTLKDDVCEGFADTGLGQVKSVKLKNNIGSMPIHLAVIFDWGISYSPERFIKINNIPQEWMKFIN